MSGGRIKLDLDSILQGYGFLTMLPSGDLLNFGNTGNNHLPLAILVSISGTIRGFLGGAWVK